MDLKSELLKSIWYAFTSLEVVHSGKVSKSQLKVLSHNLYTALNIPHDPVALEEHFQDNDNGPVSDHGYMPYLNKYILAKATEGTFNKETFDDLCWMMSAKKNFKPTVLQGVCSQRDCFKLFCLFNLLSEDRYPLVIIQPELEYLLKKISTAMNLEWDGRLLDELLSQDPSLQEGLSVWMFLEQMSAGCLMQIESKEAFSLALDDVFMEMYHNVLKKGYMFKKGHVHRSWQERWFTLKPSILVYYTNEDQKEKKGEVQLDGNCVVETMADKDGRRCLFCVKTPGRTYEMSATDQKQRVEWIQAIQTALRLKAEGKTSLHQELKLRRREQRALNQTGQSGQNSQSGQTSQSQSNQRSLSQSSQSETSPEAEQHSPVTQQGEPESKEPDLEIIDIIQQHLEMEAQRRKEDALEKEKQKEKQQELERQLEEANMARESLIADVAKMEREVQQQKRRIQELELTQKNLEEALNTQIQCRLEEETARHELERLLEEERMKLAELMFLQKHLEAPVHAERIQEETPEPLENEESSFIPCPASAFTSVDPPSSSSQTITCPAQTAVGTEQTHQNNMEKISPNHSKASHMRHWSVQMTRLMKPITPADKIERLPVRANCPKQDQALTSAEFIIKYQPTITQEIEFSNSQVRNKEEEADSQEPVIAPEAEPPTN